MPKEMTLQDIQELKDAWVAAVKRGLSAGIDFIEIYAAHGYLLSSLLSASSKISDWISTVVASRIITGLFSKFLGLRA